MLFPLDNGERNDALNLPLGLICRRHMGCLQDHVTAFEYVAFVNNL